MADERAEIGRNEVSLIGRVSGEVTERELASGASVANFRLVVPRTQRTAASRATVDTIDIACWSARTRRGAARLTDVVVVVDGRLRRRFFGTATGRASRYEVEARSLRQVRR